MQPAGTVTLLFSDVEGSTVILERLGAARFAEVLELHRRLLREAFERYGGYEVDEAGDGFLVAFGGAVDAVTAAAAGQRSLAEARWPESVELCVRMGVHTGEPLPVGRKYVGVDVHRAARVMAAAHGGQVLVSETTAVLLDSAPLRDLGLHRLKDLLAPIRLFQLELEGRSREFPPVRSLHQRNLPLAGWPLLGRERELEKIGGLVSSGARLVTLTGPGGSGKTRLALQAAAELSDEFADGVFFVALASLRDTAAVRGTVAEAVGLKPDDDVTAWLDSRRVLLVLDNLEHLRGVEGVVAELLVADVVVLATSRAPLHLSEERELGVEPLPDEAAMELFVSRAAAAGRDVEANDVAVAICRRLDNLPLALELAAARAKLLSPAALLQRLDAALPLLTGGARDLPERQKTLRAAIEWSHDLLDPDAEAAFRRVSVFRGSFTLAAAEAAADADLDQLATLLDQSLLKPLGDERFFMLETLREYAREQLDLAAETGVYALRHARHYLAQLDGNDIRIHHARRGELLAWYTAEEDNLRAMLDRLIEAAPEEAARAADVLNLYWIARGAYTEAQQRLRTVIEIDGLATSSRAPLLACLSEVEEFLGHLDAAEAAAQEAVTLAETNGQASVLAAALRDLAWVADRRGDTEQAIRLQTRSLKVATALDERRRVLALHDLGVFMAAAGRNQEARTMLHRAAEGAQAIGNRRLAIDASANLAEIDLHAHDFESAYSVVASAIARNLELEYEDMPLSALLELLGWAALGLGRREEARSAFTEALERMVTAAMTSHYEFSRTLAGIALAADAADARQSARLRGAATSLRQQAEFQLKPEDRELEELFEEPLLDALGEEAWTREQTAAAAMSVKEAIELARSLSDREPRTPNSGIDPGQGIIAT